MDAPADREANSPLRATLLVCSLKPSPAPSSSQKLGREVLAELEQLGARTREVRVADHDVRFGVTADEGDGDAWPSIRQQVLDSDVLVLATPIWMGQPASVAKMVLERLDNETAQTDDEGRPVCYGKVAVVAVVGNEDGAHHSSASIMQALVDVGFTVPAQAVTYWTGEAMHGTDYHDLPEVPEAVASTTSAAARNAHHLATALRASPYPAS